MKLGEFVRSQRVGKGIDLEKAAEDTRIKEVYLRAIEDENYDLIPGEVYQRHYFKTYLEYLGLEELYYRLTRERPKPAPMVERMVRKPTEDIWDTARYVRVAGRLLILALVVIAFIWVLGAFAFSGNKNNNANKSPDEGIGEVLDHLPVPGINPQDELEKKISETLGEVEDLGDVPGKIAGAMDKHSVRLEFDGVCWLRVKGPEGIIFQGHMEEGDSKEFGPEKFFIITFGKPENARVYFDDVHIYGGEETKLDSYTIALPADISIDETKFNVPMDEVVGS